MIVFPAIDIYEGRAVRLLYGDYGKMTVYSDNPVGVACEMRSCGMTHIHIVDLEGARDGGSPNMELIAEIKRKSGLFCEVGGGIRTAETAKKYFERGIDRVIFGTAAATDPGFMKAAAELFGEKAAVGADVRDGRIAIRGWRGLSDLSLHDLASSRREQTPLRGAFPEIRDEHRRVGRSIVGRGSFGAGVARYIRGDSRTRLL